MSTMTFGLPFVLVSVQLFSMDCSNKHRAVADSIVGNGSQGNQKISIKNIFFTL